MTRQNLETIIHHLTSFLQYTVRGFLVLFVFFFLRVKRENELIVNMWLLTSDGAVVLIPVCLNTNSLLILLCFQNTNSIFEGKRK